jgi:hypothetical protein
MSTSELRGRVVGRDVLGLAGGVAGDQHGQPMGAPQDLSGVVLEEAVVAVGAGKVEGSTAPPG